MSDKVFSQWLEQVEEEVIGAVHSLKGESVRSIRRELLQRLREACESGNKKIIRKTIAEIRKELKKISATRKTNVIDDWPKNIPTPEYIRAFEKGAKSTLEKLEYDDSRKITFIVDSVNLERSPLALFSAISTNILGKMAAAKGRQLCIYIRDGKTPDEAKRLIEQAEAAAEVDQKYLCSFEKGAKRRLEEMNPNEHTQITFNVGLVKFERSPSGLFSAVSVEILGTRSEAKGKELCIHIRNGKTPNQAKILIEQEERSKIIDKNYLLALQKGAGIKLEKISPYDTNPIKFVVGSVSIERSPGAVFDSVARNILGTSSPLQGKRFCIFIRDGKTPDEARRLVFEAGILSEKDQAYLLAFEKSAGRKLEDMKTEDDSPVMFIVGSVRLKRSPRALFKTISRNLIGEVSGIKGKRLCILIRDGKTIEEAKDLLKEIDAANEITSSYLIAFEKKAGKTLEEIKTHDSSLVTFKVGTVIQKRSAYAIFSAISMSIFGKHAAGRGKQLCIYIRDGKTPDEAKRLIEQAEAAAEVNCAYLLAFERGAKCKLEDMNPEDYSPVTFIVDSVRQERSPGALFKNLAKNILSSNSPNKGKELCVYIRNGKPLDEAKWLVEFGEEEIIDDQFKDLSDLKLEEAIALYQNDPKKLDIYLRIYHPELTEEQREKLIFRSFRGLTNQSNETKEEEYLEYSEELVPVKLTEKSPTETDEHTIMLEGTAVGADAVYVAGCWNCRARVNKDGNFKVGIPLKIGEKNAIRLMGINRDQETRSHQLHFVVEQAGTPDDISALIDSLNALGGELLEEIKKNPGKFNYLVDSMEHVLIKKFASSWESGESYVQELIAKSKNPTVRNVLRKVIRSFKEVKEMDLPQVNPNRPLYFFQKYCVKFIQDQIAASAPGLVLGNAPGTGKTGTTQAALSDEYAVVISPNNVVSTWEEEAHETLIDPDILVLRNMSHTDRKELLRGDASRHRVTNREFLQKVEDHERFKLLSDARHVIVIDEGHSLTHLDSLQTQGTKKLRGKFLLIVTASPAKNPKMLRRLFSHLYPKDRRFSSDKAFQEAFPQTDPNALRNLRLLLQKNMVRFTKEDVMEEMDPGLPPQGQLDRLPRKEHIPPKELGEFTMLNEQAWSIYKMFLNWDEWKREYGEKFPKGKIAEMDRLRRSGNQLAKKHAMRQLINNPAYVGVKGKDPKADIVRKIVKQCDREGRPATIFSAYNLQTQKYQGLFADHHPAFYTGITSLDGEKRGLDGKPQKFAHAKHKERGATAWAFDETTGHLAEDPEGKSILALDYERLRFQNANDCTMLIATYKAGAQGTTFTRGKAMIFDDLADDIIEEYQAEDRIHRIDHKHQTHTSVKYYKLISTYPPDFLEEMKKRWVRKMDDGTYEEVRSRKVAEAEDLPTAFDQFFAQGTYDQVHNANLRTQREIFHLIQDGFGDESLLKTDQIKISGLNGDSGNS